MAPGVVLALSLSLAAASCSGSDEKSPAGPGSPSAAPPLTTTARAGEVVGKLDTAATTKAVDEVQEVVDGWLDAAFTGPFPRADFADAFPGFTAGAARSARQDLDELTAASVADDIDGLTATRRTLAVDLLAVRGVARTATARVRLDYTTTGDTAVDRTLLGRLFLTFEGGRWTVFGYDVAQGLSGRPAASASSSGDPSPSPTTGSTDSTGSTGSTDSSEGSAS
ncbi:hypothetical protein GCM10022215_09200 [Nocardioides fonticola]|uniref:Mce-associated membrane protein n=1 Tax=Nocardioides fonticola TaxID=450363 RepID=A0ABP7XE91_9ACTN